MAVRLGFVKDENGNLVRKWVNIGEENDPKYLFPVNPQFGGVAFVDKEHLEEAKAIMLEQIVDAIRQLAKRDEFWIVKTAESEWNDFIKSPLREMQPDMTREEFISHLHGLKDGKCSVGWKMELPQMEGYYPFEQREQIQKELNECMKHQ